MARRVTARPARDRTERKAGMVPVVLAATTTAAAAATAGVEVFGIPLAIASPLSGAGMLLIAVSLVIVQTVIPLRKGLLIPKETYDAHVKYVEDNRDDWKQSSQAKDLTIANLTEANRLNAEALKVIADETGQTVIKTMRAMQQGVDAE
jgi:hypothetical protein